MEVSKATSDKMNKTPITKGQFRKPFELLRIYILREYLQRVEFPPEAFVNIEKITFELDFERVIDDFVFMVIMTPSRMNQHNSVHCTNTPVSSSTSAPS